MKRATLQSKTVQQLVAEFLAIALAQYEAIEMDEHAKFNRLYAKMEDVRQELKIRAGDQRKALLPLLNMQIRRFDLSPQLPHWRLPRRLPARRSNSSATGTSIHRPPTRGGCCGRSMMEATCRPDWWFGSGNAFPQEMFQLRFTP